MGIQKDWTRLVGGISNEYGKSIGISSDGSIYLAGTTYGNLDDQIGIGASDIFLSKFNRVS